MTHITIQRSEMETNNQIEVLAKQCGWDNRRYMTPSDYQIWCDRMRQFVQLASPPAAPVQEPIAAPKIEWVDTDSGCVVRYLNGYSRFDAKQIGEMLDFAAMAANKFYATPPAAQPAPVPLALWTEAQHERAYRNSPELHKDVKSLAAFKRVAKEVAAMYGITKGQP